MMFTVPDKKVQKLEDRLNEICEGRRASPSIISSITGTLSSMRRSIGPIIALMTRSTYANLDQNRD